MRAAARGPDTGSSGWSAAASFSLPPARVLGLAAPTSLPFCPCGPSWKGTPSPSRQGLWAGPWVPCCACGHRSDQPARLRRGPALRSLPLQQGREAGHAVCGGAHVGQRSRKEVSAAVPGSGHKLFQSCCVSHTCSMTGSSLVGEAFSTESPGASWVTDCWLPPSPSLHPGTGRGWARPAQQRGGHGGPPGRCRG